jgi:hypothetical protein
MKNEKAFIGINDGNDKFIDWRLSRIFKKY